ncbi:NAD(P)-binding protein [Lasiodiplodia theobromae]|uniref:NAD(P)-binding protein n=1 Tax=Lasiodiplodia theobromae TaxID=45133 RepID=UPI0015C35C17|nr:NAD(P)-binding protein [Lasiodiplodia theobromae]KAF4536182.1 NAD(P)-binding protein [Lasiodiplodia theobromae]
MTVQKLRIGIAGLGRMGKRHALNLHTLTHRAEVVAVSSPDQNECKWAMDQLDGVRVYRDYDEMLAKEDLQTIVIASATAVHATQTLSAIEKGYHVLCEKPLSIDVAELSSAQSVVDAYKRSLRTHPNQKVMCAFSRRFDASYREAYEKVVSGDYGRPVVFRSQTADLLDTSGVFVNYAKTSGGIFLDCSIHDIDLMLWFLEEKSKIKSLHAIGVTAVHPGLETINDRDNAIAIIEFYDGRIANLFCTRMMAAGQEDTTEIICQKGAVRVNMQGQKNHVEVHDKLGSRQVREFTECCLENTPLRVSLESSVRALAIGRALQHSLVSGEKVIFDEICSRL